MTDKERELITKLEHVSASREFYFETISLTGILQCNFSKVKEYQEEQREIRKNRSKEEKNKEKEDKQKIDDEYGFCMWDKHKGEPLLLLQDPVESSI